ncbi:MAG TPA: CocE/NonD family hydrolase, partial [Candidatus Nitrosotenuis sp.]|nr:CocE/NonD family hydrolase [Candidatus Nitrosotenuis sp.]
GAVLAAIESPPHLKAMVPAMTFSTPRNFIYSGGVFDGSWPLWIWTNIAPDVRVRKNLEGPRTGADARKVWPEVWQKMQRVLPLSAVTELRDVAPWYYEWLKHPPDNAWWNVLDLRDKYARVHAAVLNFSGWYDEAYGPEGAITNFTGLLEQRSNMSDPRTRLIIGPWVHGVPGPEAVKAGERTFGPQAVIDYDEMVLRWMDRYVRGLDNGVDKEPRVRVFVMNANRWLEHDWWPLGQARPTPYFLFSTPGVGKPGQLSANFPRAKETMSSFVSDPANPVTDSFPPYTGGHDYSALAQRGDVLVWETPPLASDVEVVGQIEAVIYISCDAPDTDLWVKLFDVDSSGKAVNLMSPGLDVLRASYRDPQRRSLLEPGKVYELRLKNLMTGNLFPKGHRIRVQISAAFFPNFSRNLHTGLLETTESGEMRKATITVHLDAAHPSRIILPVVAR